MDGLYVGEGTRTPGTRRPRRTQRIHGAHRPSTLIDHLPTDLRRPSPLPSSLSTPLSTPPDAPDMTTGAATQDQDLRGHDVLPLHTDTQRVSETE